MKEQELRKHASTEFPVIDLITKRWSPRAFSHKPILKQDLNTLFEAASWAASSRNEQPWRYIYAIRKNREEFDRIHSCLTEGNQDWTIDAPVLMICLAEKLFSETGKVNPHSQHDLGSANTTLLLQARSMHIFGHMMAGFKKEKTIETFHIPNHLEPVCFMALGYLGNARTLNDKNLESELSSRKRKKIEKFAFEGKLPGVSLGGG